MKVMLIHEDRNGDCLMVEEDFSAEWHGMCLLVEAGFRSDGVSIPRPFWALVGAKVDPSSCRAGVCHDWIYRIKPAGWTRAMADAMFRDFLREDGFGILRAWACWLAVRLFGWMAWNENRNSVCAGCPMDCNTCWRKK